MSYKIKYMVRKDDEENIFKVVKKYYKLETKYTMPPRPKFDSEEEVYSGSLADCNAYIELKEKGRM